MMFWYSFVNCFPDVATMRCCSEILVSSCVFVGTHEQVQ